jgi:hypothetical protein
VDLFRRRFSVVHAKSWRCIHVFGTACKGRFSYYADRFVYFFRGVKCTHVTISETRNDERLKNFRVAHHRSVVRLY